MKLIHGFMAFGLPLLFAATTAQAQEAAATSSVNLTATWNALNTQVNESSTKSDMVNTRIDQIVVCNKKNMMYAPGGGADSSGCIENSAIAQLQTKVATINGQLGPLNQQLTDLNGKLTGLTTQLATVQGTLTNLGNQIAGLITLSNDLNVKAANAINSINDLYARMSVVTGQVTSLYTTVNTHTTQIADLYAKIAAINTQVTSLSSSIASANNLINSLNGTAAGLNSQIANILYCGANNLIYNRNVGCVTPAGSGSCHMVIASTGHSSCPGGQYLGAVCAAWDDGNHGGGSSGGGNSGGRCSSTAYTCYAMSCS